MGMPSVKNRPMSRLACIPSSPPPDSRFATAARDRAARGAAGQGLRFRAALVLLSVLFFSLFLSACERIEETAPGDGDAAEAGALLWGEVERTLVSVPSPRPDVEVGRVTGAVEDGAGRIVVVESDPDRIRVHSASGDFLYLVGTSGGGPGEYRSPCCPAVAPDGRLWVRDRGNERYLAFTLREGEAVFESELRMSHENAVPAVAPTFDADGRLVDVGRDVEPRTGRERVVRVHRDADGRVLRRDEIPVPPADSLGAARLASELATVFIHPPFGPRHLVAHGPGGGWATAVSDRYLVEWQRPEGGRVTVRGPDAPGPPVTAAERREAEAHLQAFLERLDVEEGALDLRVPDRQPPLEALLFEREGRLWVSLLVPEGEPREAHVYGPDGRRVATVRWPAGIALLSDGLGRERALGVVRENGEERVVLLRFVER